MKPGLALCLTALILTACDDEQRQARSTFELNDHPYHWSVLGFPGRASLILARQAEVGRGRVVFTIACTDPGYGSLTSHFGDLVDGPLTVNAAGQLFAVEARRRTNRGRIDVFGEGYIPEGWYKSLERTDQIVISEGVNRWAFPSPGEAVSRRFSRLCHGRR